MCYFAFRKEVLNMQEEKYYIEIESYIKKNEVNKE